MQDPQEMPAEQQVANSQETMNTQAANAEQVVSNGEQQSSAQAQQAFAQQIQQAAAQTQQPPAQAQPWTSGRIAELEAQLAQARKEAAENWNRYLLTRADVDNIRKRQDRLIADRVQQLKKSLFKQILEVMDNVERALVYQETMDKQELQQILRMLQWQMGEVLRAEGLSPVPTVGETFNPYMHEAVEAVEGSDKPEGTVLEELRKGYTLGEETLRPARVKVSTGK
jgi:molecular chaperone GrpE